MLSTPLTGGDGVRRRACGWARSFLTDAFKRVLDAADLVGCMGVIVDAKDEGAEPFHAKYGFETIPALMDLPVVLPLALLGGRPEPALDCAMFGCMLVFGGLWHFLGARPGMGPQVVGQNATDRLGLADRCVTFVQTTRLFV